MAQNRSALSLSDAAALRQRFADREAGSLETLARSGRARLHQKLASTPIARPAFMLPLVSSLTGLAILGAAFTFLPRSGDTVAPVQTAVVSAPVLISSPLLPAPVTISHPATNTTPPANTPSEGRRMRRPYAIPAPAPVNTIFSEPHSLKAASVAGAGEGPVFASIEHQASSIEPEVHLAKTNGGISVSWAAQGGEKFIVSKTCYQDHNVGNSYGATSVSRVMLIGSGVWLDSIEQGGQANCSQARYEVRRVA